MLTLRMQVAKLISTLQIMTKQGRTMWHYNLQFMAFLFYLYTKLKILDNLFKLQYDDKAVNKEYDAVLYRLDAHSSQKLTYGLLYTV